MQGMLSQYRVFAMALVVCCAMVFGIGLAVSEAGPDDIKGEWDAVANNTSVKLIIKESMGFVTGTLNGQAIEGYYLKGVRRLVFARKSSNGQPYQLYVAAVSSLGWNMAGTFLVWNAVGGVGPKGIDYNFSATRVDNIPK